MSNTQNVRPSQCFLMTLRSNPKLRSNDIVFQAGDARQPECNVDMPWSYSGVDERFHDRDSGTAGLE